MRGPSSCLSFGPKITARDAIIYLVFGLSVTGCTVLSVVAFVVVAPATAFVPFGIVVLFRHIASVCFGYINNVSRWIRFVKEKVFIFYDN
jgi:hypothetical protein